MTIAFTKRTDFSCLGDADLERWRRATSALKENCRNAYGGRLARVIMFRMQVVPGSKTLGDILQDGGGLSKFLFEKSENKRKRKVCHRLADAI